MANRTRILASLLLVAAACGDDGNKNNNDGGNGDGGNTCATAPLQITSVPGMVMGTVVGGGADLTVPETGCAETYDWFDPVGEDTVVAVSGLTVGQRYGITLQSKTDDLSAYITAECPPATGMVTGCTSFVDTAFPFFTNDPEIVTFTATASTHYIVVDTSATMMNVEDGDFTLEVTNATCGPQTEAADCAQGMPYCVDFACKQCITSFDCMSGTPSCDTMNSCVAGPATCTGDDTREGGTSDDGPSVATVLTAPTGTTPTTITGAICSSPLTEEDWYRIDLTEDVSVSLTFTGATTDIDIYLYDQSGEVVTGSVEDPGINEAFLTEDIKAGTYYLLVTQYAPQNTAAATNYTLTVALPECTPDEWPLPDCNTAAESTCNSGGQCAAGPMCTGDDAGDPNDDGPAGAQTLANNTPKAGKACTLQGESDYYKFTVTNGQGKTLTLDWTDATQDFDLSVTDATGKPYGFSINAKPEVVTLTNLPDGTYYAQVINFAQTGTATVADYTLTGVTTAVQQCTVANNQCAAEFKTQIYRGLCTPATDVCSFIPDNKAVALGGKCDSTGDCSGTNVCSYRTFQSNAELSVCGPMTCAADADCAAAGTAAGETLKCSGFQTKTCLPACDADTDCGASNGTTFTPGFPWDYFTCTVATGVCGP